MYKITALGFYNVFEDYNIAVTREGRTKIEYSTWRILNGVFKKLQMQSFNGDDWEAMPFYINVYTERKDTEDEMGFGVSVVTKLDFHTPDRNIEFYGLVIPWDFGHDLAGVINDCKTNKIYNDEKEIDEMNTTTNTKNDTMREMMPSFDFGPVTGDTVRVSPYGMAIRNKDGVWVSYNANDGSVINVAGFTFDLNQMLFKVPVALNQVQKGDMVIHNRTPMYVTEISTDGKQIGVVDIREGEVKTVMPLTNMFGFNFVTKVVSLINFQTSAPDPNNPFGNIMPFIFMSSMFGGDGSENLGDMFKGDFGKMMMYSMMFGGGMGAQNPFANLFGGLMPQTTPAPSTAPIPMIDDAVLRTPPVEVTNGVNTGNPPQMV